MHVRLPVVLVSPATDWLQLQCLPSQGARGLHPPKGAHKNLLFIHCLLCIQPWTWSSFLTLYKMRASGTLKFKSHRVALGVNSNKLTGNDFLLVWTPLQWQSPLICHDHWPCLLWNTVCSLFFFFLPASDSPHVPKCAFISHSYNVCTLVKRQHNRFSGSKVNINPCVKILSMASS